MYSPTAVLHTSSMQTVKASIDSCNPTFHPGFPLPQELSVCLYFNFNFNVLNYKVSCEYIQWLYIYLKAYREPKDSGTEANLDIYILFSSSLLCTSAFVITDTKGQGQFLHHRRERTNKKGGTKFGPHQSRQQSFSWTFWANLTSSTTSIVELLKVAVWHQHFWGCWGRRSKVQ